jgi:hypothetical protein
MGGQCRLGRDQPIRLPLSRAASRTYLFRMNATRARLPRWSRRRSSSSTSWPRRHASPPTRPPQVAPTAYRGVPFSRSKAWLRKGGMGARSVENEEASGDCSATSTGCLCCLGGCRGSGARRAGPPRIGTGRTSGRPAMLGAALRGSARRTPRRSESSLPGRAGCAPV